MRGGNEGITATLWRVADRVAVAVAAELSVKQFARLSTGGGMAHDVFHVERNGKHYLLDYYSGSNVAFGIEASGSSGSVASSFDRHVENLVRGTKLYGGEWEVVTERLDAPARKRLEVFDHPRWGVDWGEDVEIESDLDEFHRMLKRQLSDWKGSGNSLPIAKHRYWSTFSEMVKVAVAKKYGGSIKLFRGVHGEQAANVIRGSALRLKRFSSWTDDAGGAKTYRRLWKREAWVVVATTFSSSAVALAPVVLPGYDPDPRVLLRLAHDVESSGDELVVESSGSLSRFSVPYKTTRKV